VHPPGGAPPYLFRFDVPHPTFALAVLTNPSPDRS
jgi:hypothetical protein